MIMSLEMLNYFRGQQGLLPLAPVEPTGYPEFFDGISSELFAYHNIETGKPLPNNVTMSDGSYDGWELEWYGCSSEWMHPDEWCDFEDCYSFIQVVGEGDDFFINYGQKADYHWVTNEFFDSVEDFQAYWLKANHVVHHPEHPECGCRLEELETIRRRK